MSKTEQLKDGRTATIESIGPAELEAFLLRCDEERTIEAGRTTALAATVRRNERVEVAGAAWFTATDDGTGSAWFGIAVDPSCQGIGVASMLLKHLIDSARAVSIQILMTDIDPGDQRMLSLLFHTGLTMKYDISGGIMHVTVEITVH
ncbi:MAG TPA: GNAT family N-acetyltransferase [Dissulfurispiraceae bacterium]|nr:GNAT family N-acetyltransferase [Dissulfurispiraceae bacterium]